MKTNLVITAYGGLRAAKHRKYDRDKTVYLRKQLELLWQVKNRLSQVTIVLNQANAPREFNQFFSDIPSVINGIPVVKFSRLNSGISYGAFSDAYGMFRREFDYYAFVEDDWAFVLNDWDSILIELIQRKQTEDSKFHYICGRALPWPRLPNHASISVGMMTSESLEAVWNMYGFLPNSETWGDYNQNKEPGQILFSKGFLDAGYDMFDWRNHYRTPYINDERAFYFFSENKDTICQIIELLPPSSYPVVSDKSPE